MEQKSNEKNSKIIIIIVVLMIIFGLIAGIDLGVGNLMKKVNEPFRNETSISKNEVANNKANAEITYKIIEDIINNKVTIKLVVNSEKGIKQVELPNGTVQYFNNEKNVEIKYTVDKNSDYTFKITEIDGNIIEKVINVSKIKDENGIEETNTTENNIEDVELQENNNVQSGNINLSNDRKQVDSSSSVQNNDDNNESEKKENTEQQGNINEQSQEENIDNKENQVDNGINNQSEENTPNNNQENNNENNNNNSNEESESNTENNNSNNNENNNNEQNSEEPKDTIAPNEYVPETTRTTCSIAINGTTIDNKTSAENLKYYYSIDNGTSYTEEKGTTYTFENLIQNTEYNICVKVVDEAGNERIVKVNCKTLKVPEYNINDVIYNNKVITANNINNEYTLLYAIGEDGQFSEYIEPFTIDGVGKTKVRFKYLDKNSQEGEESFTEKTVVPDANGNIEIILNTEERVDSVTISIQDNLQKEELKIQYKIGEGDWQGYSEPFDVTQNIEVYARYVASDDENNIGEATSKEINNINVKEVTGKVYFEKPNEWATPYAYFRGDIKNTFPGVALKREKGKIYSFEITEDMLPSNVEAGSLNFTIQFNNGGNNTNSDNECKYKIKPAQFDGCNKLYKVLSGETVLDGSSSTGEWENYEDSQEVLGRVYLNNPVAWEHPHVYIYNDNSGEQANLFGEWPGMELTKEQDYIYYIEITKDMIASEENLANYKIIFNNGGKFYNQGESRESYRYELKTLNWNGFNKIYNVTSGLGTTTGENEGEWLDYNSDIKIGKIPKTTTKAKNVIYMIGDGMGDNHIKAAQIYKGSNLNMQTIENKTHVTTASTETVTDSAAAATALATGEKTKNNSIGLNRYRI